MEKKSVYLGTIKPFKNKIITIIGETRRFYRFKILVKEFSPLDRADLMCRGVRRLSDFGMDSSNDFYSGMVLKKNIKLCDILPDELFKL